MGRAVPWKRSWWVDDHLMGGAYPGAATPDEARRKVEDIVSAGITLFLDLTTPQDRLEPYKHLIDEVEGTLARCVSVAVPDLTPPTAEQITRCLTIIDDEAGRGGVTYVHCWGGIGRTGSVVGCYLARTIGGDAALDRLEELRRDSADAGRRAPETAGQVALVRGWPVAATNGEA